MEKYSWLLKQRGKAVGLFDKVMRKLDEVHLQMNTQVELSKRAITIHEAAIQSAQTGIEGEKTAIEYLEAEKAKTLATKAKIADIIGSA